MYQNRSLQVKTAPAVEPVLLGDVKNHLRVLSSIVGGAVSLAAAPTGVVRASGVVTVTPATGQPIPALGQTVTLAGITDATFNAANLVVQSVDAQAKTFAVNIPGPDSTSGGGTYQVSQADDEDLIIGLIKAARRTAEAFTRRALITQTLVQYLDHWPRVSFATLLNPRSLYSPHRPFIRLFNPPLQSVTSIKYTDQNGTQQTWDASNYIVDAVSEPARIALAFGAFFPAIRVLPQSVVIEYKAGYGDTPSTVPEDIQAAIKLLVGHLYENREAIGQNNQAPLPFAVESLLWNHRVLEF